MSGNTRSRTTFILENILSWQTTGHMGVRAVPLDPQLQAIRDQRERDCVPPLYAMSLTEARAGDLASIRQSGGEPEPVYEVANLTITGSGGELPLRLYRPTSERP